MSKKKHWNDEMVELERMAMNHETNQPSVESWDWRWRAEQAEAKVKNLEEALEQYDGLVEQAKVGIYQIQENAKSLAKNTTRLLRRCYEVLKQSDFGYTLDPNPAVRKRQIEERTQTKRDLIHALEIFLKTMEEKERKQDE